jgi:hypothetical protein
MKKEQHEAVKDANGRPKREELTLAMQKEQEERVKECVKEIEVALAKHKCVILAQPFIDTDGTIKARPGVNSQ